jgi:hypothetical protein
LSSGSKPDRNAEVHPFASSSQSKAELSMEAGLLHESNSSNKAEPNEVVHLLLLLKVEAAEKEKVRVKDKPNSDE